jgi:hypothetical protein
VPQPGEKVLAVQQPDHTIHYMDFRGLIGRGYGAGTVKAVDRLQTEVHHSEPGKVKFRLDRGRGGEEFILRRTGKHDQSTKWLLQNVTKEKTAFFSAVNNLPQSSWKHRWMEKRMRAGKDLGLHTNAEVGKAFHSNPHWFSAFPTYVQTYKVASAHEKTAAGGALGEALLNTLRMPQTANTYRRGARSFSNWVHRGLTKEVPGTRGIQLLPKETADAFAAIGADSPLAIPAAASAGASFPVPGSGELATYLTLLADRYATRALGGTPPARTTEATKHLEGLVRKAGKKWIGQSPETAAPAMRTGLEGAPPIISKVASALEEHVASSSEQVLEAVRARVKLAAAGPIIPTPRHLEMAEEIVANDSLSQDNWLTFQQRLQRSPGYRQAVLLHPQADAKLKRHVRAMGALHEGTHLKKVQSLSGPSTYQLKLMSSGRLGCTCPDWRYRKSHGGGDCKHVRAFRSAYDAGEMPRGYKGLQNALKKVSSVVAAKVIKQSLDDLPRILRSAVRNYPNQTVRSAEVVAQAPPWVKALLPKGFKQQLGSAGWTADVMTKGVTTPSELVGKNIQKAFDKRYADSWRQARSAGLDLPASIKRMGFGS